MSKRKKSIIINLVVYLILLIAIVGGIALHLSNIKRFNNTEHIYRPGETGDILFQFAPRGGATDSWTKFIPVDGHPEGGYHYQAVIYEATITNLTKYKISDWEWKVNFDRTCYFNNAWCGKLDFHQKDKNQVIDLRAYNLEEIKLDYLYPDSDLMITMNSGDYLVYQPSVENYENTMEASDLDNSNYQYVTIGFITYNREDVGINLDNYEIKYYLETSFWKEKASYWYIGALVLWALAFVIFVIVEICITIAYRRFKRDERIVKQSLDVFTTFFDAKDPYTNGHSKRVAEYASKIAKKLKFSDEECNKIFYIGLMHDCGKCYIPDEILKKPGKLTAEEFDLIKSHTTKGAEMLKDFDAVENIKEGALYHHERYDGGGYPSGKKGEDIPLIARIICVADSFDAMNSSRCYRGKLTKDKIISELKENSGKQFDPKIAEIMLELINEGAIDMDI